MRQPTEMTVPLVDLKAQYDSIRADVFAAITRVCDSQQFILGPEVELLEQELAEYLSAKHAVGVSSGTDALLAIMMGLGIGPGDEVITTTYSFFSAAGSIVRLGATPVFVDIDPDTFNIDPDAAGEAMTSRTKAIVPVHLFGLSADLDPLLTVTSRSGVSIIEDSCQAIGARYKGQCVGALGMAGGLSFFPSKSLGAYGDAGLIATNDDALAEHLHSLRVHGAQPRYVHKRVGGNFRLDAIQAAVLRVKLPHLNQWCRARREVRIDTISCLPMQGWRPLVLSFPSSPRTGGTPIINTLSKRRGETSFTHIWSHAVSGPRFTIRYRCIGRSASRVLAIQKVRFPRPKMPLALRWRFQCIPS